MNGHGWFCSAEEVISDEWPFCFEKYSLWFYKIVARLAFTLSEYGKSRGQRDNAP